VVKSNGLLHVDIEWYVTQQILPPIARLCEPIAGTSMSRLAECLGLDGSRFLGRQTGGSDANDMARIHSLMSDEELYRNCEHIHFACYKCLKLAGAYTGPLAVAGNSNGITTYRCGLICPNPECEEGLLFPIPREATASTKPSGLEFGADATGAIASALMVPAGAAVTEVLTMRLTNHISSCVRHAQMSQYSAVMMECDEHACGMRVKGPIVTVRDGGKQCPRPRCRGKLQLLRTPADLHRQLEYLDWCFNYEKALKRKTEQGAGLVEGTKISAAHSMIFDMARREVDRALKQNAYNYVGLKEMTDYIRDVNAIAKIDMWKVAKLSGLDQVLRVPPPPMLQRIRRQKT
jgi:DNA polymerase alpha subunit A